MATYLTTLKLGKQANNTQQVEQLQTEVDSLKQQVQQLTQQLQTTNNELNTLRNNLNNNYFTKTQLTNYTTPLYLASDTSIGANVNQRFYVSTYSNNEIIANFTASNKRTILARGSDKRITQIGNNDEWRFGN